MADHNIDIILRARDLASKQIKAVNKSLSDLGSRASKGLRTAGRNLLRLGAIAGGVAAGIGVLAVRQGVDSLVTLENAVTSVDGAIKNMGLTGKMTGAQIATWANEIEAATEAAFDDKDITAATASLIRYGRIAPNLIRPAMEVMTDLAARTGSVESAQGLLSKALADPTKATRALRTAGIALTEAQTKQIKKWVEGGKRAKAQRFILDQLRKTTKGAAKDAFGPVADAQNQMNDAIEDTSRAFATGFLPLIVRASKAVQGFLARSDVQKGIRDLGDGLARAFESAMDFASKIPWDRVKESLGIAADFAGKLIGAFTSMPPEVQGTIIALAGLNKLSGGAISGIVGELGKGLIKGVLGITAGVVNVTGGIVRGTPGGPGGGPPVPGGGGKSVPGGGRSPKFILPGVGAVGVLDLEELERKTDEVKGKLGIIDEKQRGTIAATERSRSSVVAAVNMSASRIAAAVAAAAPKVNVTVGVNNITKNVTKINRTVKTHGSANGGSSFWQGAGPR